MNTIQGANDYTEKLSRKIGGTVSKTPAGYNGICIRVVDDLEITVSPQYRIGKDGAGILSFNLFEVIFWSGKHSIRQWNYQTPDQVSKIVRRIRRKYLAGQ